MGKSGDEDTATFGHGDTGARGQLDVGHADTGSVGHGDNGTPGQRDAVPRGRGHSGPTRCPPPAPQPPRYGPPARVLVSTARSVTACPQLRAVTPTRVPGGSVVPLPPPAPPALFSAAGYFRCGGAASRHGDTRCPGGVSAGTARPCGPAPPAAESRPGTGRPTRVGRRRGSTCGSGPALPHAGRDRRRLRSGGTGRGEADRDGEGGPGAALREGVALCAGGTGSRGASGGGGRGAALRSLPAGGGPVGLPILPQSSGGPILPWGWAAVGCSVGPILPHVMGVPSCPNVLLQINRDSILSKRVRVSRSALGVSSSLGSWRCSGCPILLQSSGGPIFLGGSHPSPARDSGLPSLQRASGVPSCPKGFSASSCWGNPILPPGSGDSHPALGEGGGRGGPFHAGSPRSPSRPVRSLWPRG